MAVIKLNFQLKKTWKNSWGPHKMKNTKIGEETPLKKAVDVMCVFVLLSLFLTLLAGVTLAAVLLVRFVDLCLYLNSCLKRRKNVNRDCSKHA